MRYTRGASSTAMASWSRAALAMLLLTVILFLLVGSVVSTGGVEDLQSSLDAVEASVLGLRGWELCVCVSLDFFILCSDLAILGSVADVRRAV